MPLYEYECKACHQRTEKIQSFNAPPEKVCPKCGGELERVISAPALQFKGAGWYVNDYAKGSGGSPAPGSKASPAETANSGGAKEASNGTTGDSGSAAATTPPAAATAAPSSAPAKSAE